MTRTSIDNWTAKIDGDVVRTPGVDWGRPLEILHRHKNRLVLRRKGHMTWSGIGSSIYAETLYMLVELRGGSATVIEEAEPGRKYRPVVANLIKKCGGKYEPPPPKEKKPKKEHPNLALMRDLASRRVFSSLTQSPHGERTPEYVIRVSWSAAFDPDDKGEGHRIRRGEVTANLGIEGIIQPFTAREMQDITFAAKMAAARCLRARKALKRRSA